MEPIEDSVDDDGHYVAARFSLIKGKYLEWASEKSSRINYHMKKNVYVYQFVNFDIRKNFTSGIMIAVTFFPISSIWECLHYKNILHVNIACFASFYRPGARQNPEKQHATTDQSYLANGVTLTGVTPCRSKLSQKH